MRNQKNREREKKIKKKIKYFEISSYLYCWSKRGTVACCIAQQKVKGKQEKHGLIINSSALEHDSFMGPWCTPPRLAIRY